MTKIKFIIVLVLAAWLLIIPAKTRAFTISELNVEVSVDPGQTIERVVELYDDALQGLTVYPVVYNFQEDPELPGTAVVITDPAELKPDREWIEYDVDRIELPADGSRVQFTYRIHVPQDGEPGTHLISLVFRNTPPDSQGSTAINIGTNVAANIFLKVSGATIDGVSAQLQVGSFTDRDETKALVERAQTFQQKTFFTKPPVDFLITVSNTGNTHQKPDGNIKIYNDLFGSTADQVTVNRESKIVLPGSSRQFTADSFGQGFMFGKYRAKLTMLYGSPLRDATTEVVFWIIPVVELSIALGILLLLIIGIIIWVRIARRRRTKREKVKEEKMRETLREEIEKSIAPASQRSARRRTKKAPPQTTEKGGEAKRRPRPKKKASPEA